MAVTKVWIDEAEDEYTVCGVCEDSAPDVSDVD